MKQVTGHIFSSKYKEDSGSFPGSAWECILGGSCHLLMRLGARSRQTCQKCSGNHFNFKCLEKRVFWGKDGMNFHYLAAKEPSEYRHNFNDLKKVPRRKKLGLYPKPHSFPGSAWECMLCGSCRLRI